MTDEGKMPKIASIDSYRSEDREPTDQELLEIEEMGLDNPEDYDELSDDFYLGNQLYGEYDIPEV